MRLERRGWCQKLVFSYLDDPLNSNLTFKTEAKLQFNFEYAS